MFSKRMLTFFLIALINFVNCDANGIVTQINDIDLDKQRLSNQKQFTVGNLSAAGDAVKTAYLERQQAHTNSQSGFSSYYNEKIRCDGLQGSLPFLGVTPSLPNDFCLLAPVASQAYDVFVGSLKLGHKTFEKQIQQRIVDKYNAILQDALNQLASYNKFSNISNDLLQRAIKKYQACKAQNSSQSNPHPTVCDQYIQKINSKGEIYSKFRSNEYAYTTYTTHFKNYEVYRLQDILTNLTSAETSLNSQLQPKIQQLHSLKSNCDSNLQSYLSIVNSRLAISLSKQNIVESAKTNASNFSNYLDNLLAQTKPKTVKIQGLQANLKALF